jgi:hypothetical protein
MPSARAGLQLVAAPDGKLYAIGGQATASYGTSAFSTVEAYDPASNQWMTRASLPVGRANMGAALGADGKIYVFGGEGPPLGPTGAAFQASVFAYDPVTDLWATLASMSQPRTFVGVGRGPGRTLIVAGGYGYGPPERGGASWYTLTESYDIDSDTWSPRASMAFERTLQTLAPTPDGALYAIGGFPWVGDGSVVERFDPMTNQWTRRTAAPYMRYAHGAVYASGRIYVVGGFGKWDGDPNVGRLVAYDPQTDSWLPDLIAPTLTSMTLVDGAAYTSSSTVQARIVASDNATGIADASFSNDGAAWGPWTPTSTTFSWTLAPGEGSRRVHARVRDGAGNTSTTVSDTIMVDLSPPTGTATVQSMNGRMGTLRLAASDARSGVSSMRLGKSADLSAVAWQSFASTATWDFGIGPTVYVQFQDRAGNLSAVVSAAPAQPVASCEPRSKVVIKTQPAGGVLHVTINAPDPNNRIQAVRFEQMANATVDVQDQPRRVEPFTVTYPNGLGPVSLNFEVRRVTTGQAATVQIVVTDVCGDWPTFVGGGPNAF